MEYLVPVVCVHIRGVSPIQGAGLEGFHCTYAIIIMSIKYSKVHMEVIIFISFSASLGFLLASNCVGETSSSADLKGCAIFCCQRKASSIPSEFANDIVLEKPPYPQT